MWQNYPEFESIKKISMLKVYYKQFESLVDVAQLAERSFKTPEIRRSNPNIGKILVL